MVGKMARELGVNANDDSSSVSDTWEVLRMAAATARAQLLVAASLQWQLPVSEWVVNEGVVSHPSGKSAPYGQLVKSAAATPPGSVVLKPREQWNVMGQSKPRLDVPAKVNGTAQFGMDERPPGMRFVVARLCLMLGGSPGEMDSSAAMALPGVERLLPLQSYAGSTAGFAVVCKTY